jgi:hypothetical protein
MRCSNNNGLLVRVVRISIVFAGAPVDPFRGRTDERNNVLINVDLPSPLLPILPKQNLNVDQIKVRQVTRHFTHQRP